MLHWSWIKKGVTAYAFDRQTCLYAFDTWSAHINFCHPHFASLTSKILKKQQKAQTYNAYFFFLHKNSNTVIQSLFLIKSMQSNGFPELQAVQHRGTIVKPIGARMEARASTSGTRTSVSAPCATEGRTVSKVGCKELFMHCHVCTFHCLSSPHVQLWCLRVTEDCSWDCHPLSIWDNFRDPLYSRWHTVMNKSSFNWFTYISKVVPKNLAVFSNLFIVKMPDPKPL